jgi:hypothetical protein
MKLYSFTAIEVSSIVMLFSWDAKLSSSLAAKLNVVVVVAAVELSAVVVVVVRQVATSQVTAMVVVTTQVATVVVVSLNWKIQSLPHQTQCLA